MPPFSTFYTYMSRFIPNFLSRSQALLSTLMILMCVMLSSTSAQTAPKPVFPEYNREFREGVALQPFYMEQAVDSSYVLGPGDFLTLLLEEHSFLTQVGPDGTVAIEAAGIVSVDGLTLSEASEKILELASKKYDRDFCFVQLTRTKRFRVGLYGAVSRPGQHMAEHGMRLSFLLNHSGHLLANANESEIELIRGSDTIMINYHQAEYNGDQSSDPILLQGDKIIVPFQDFSKDKISIKWNDEKRISKSVRLEFQEGKDIFHFIRKSGALRSAGRNFQNVRVLDESGKEIGVYSLSEAADEKALPNTLLDLTMDKGYVYVGGSTLQRGMIPYDASYSAMDYVAASGITLFSADINEIEVVRSSGEKEKLDPIKGVVYPGDFIKLPKSRYERVKDVSLFTSAFLVATFTIIKIVWDMNQGNE